MIKLLGISGSLRKGSFNTALLRAAQQLAGDDVTLDIATLHGIPVYDGDVEAASGIPDIVQQLKERVVACDGLLLATPEYNGGIPGVVKNAIDWLSRPPADAARVFRGRPLAMIGASPGGFGTLLSQTAWLQVLRQLGVQLWGGRRMMVARAHTLIDESGELADVPTRKQLAELVQEYAAYLAAKK
jgi:chromate reductase, NAD(P)H dehydrogenase (quinone)